MPDSDILELMNQKGNVLIPGIIIGLLITVGLFGVYYLGILKNSKPQPQNPVVTSSPISASPIPSSTPDQTINSKIYTLYKNSNLGYSLKVPMLMSHSHGSCTWSSSPNAGESSYRPQSVIVPVKIFEDGNSTYISSQYYYRLGGEKQVAAKGGPGTVGFFDKCDKVDNSLEQLKDYFSNGTPHRNFEEQAWKITVEAVKDDNELSNIIQSHFSPNGPSVNLTIGEKRPTEQDGVYDVTMSNGSYLLTGLDAVIKYYPAKNKVAYWDRGQSCTFSQDIEDGTKCLDTEIINSFRFE